MRARGLFIGLEVSGNALIAPGEVRVQLGPLRLSALQRQTSDAPEFIAGIFQRIGQSQAQGLGLLRKHQTNSASRPRMRLMQAVRSALKPSRRRCTHNRRC